MSKLYFRYGAMNCGKSTALLQAAHNYEERGQNTLLIKPYADTKGADEVVSRLGISRVVDILAQPDLNLFNEISKVSRTKGVSAVFVDEAQFLEPQQVDQLFKATVIDPSVPVMAYGLRSDFQTHGFPGSIRLMEVAHVIEELITVCRCAKKAKFNGRKVDGSFVSEGSQVAIDGKANVTYESLCGKCYLQEVGDITARLADAPL